MKSIFRKSIAALLTVTLTAAPVIARAQTEETAMLLSEEEYGEGILIPEEGTAGEAIEFDEGDIMIPDEEFAPAADEIDPESVDGVVSYDEETGDDEDALEEDAFMEDAFEEDEAASEQIALMSSLIDDAVADNQEEGVYAALNSAFEALDENYQEFTDDQTGCCEVTGDEIIDSLYTSVDTYFDLDSEEMMGAIGAAASRAGEEDNNLIESLETNDTLVLLAAEQGSDDYWNRTKKYYKAVYEGSLDAIAGVCPAFKPFTPLLKAMGGTIFAEGDVDHIAEIQADLEALNLKVSESEQNLKDHMYNVVSIAMIGDKYNTVDDKAHTVLTLIKDIYDTDEWSDEKKLQDVADLYNNSEFLALLSAMNGATRCFYSSSNDIFTNMNVFDAAYNTACETVMFSQEALDVSTPYIVNQLSTYTAAYAVMSEVYDAYQKVYGSGTLKESRRQMAERLFGQDLDGNKVGKSVSELVADYLGRDRYIFVNKSNTTAIPVCDKMFVCYRNRMTDMSIKDTYYYSNWCKTPGFMPDNPLSQDQLKSLAAYCADRQETIFDFIINDMKFDPQVVTEAERKAGSQAPPPFFIESNIKRGTYFVPRGSFVYGNVYLATGHSLDKHQKGEKAWIDYTAVNATSIGAKEETVQLAVASLNGYGNILGYSYYQNCPMFFQAR